MNTIELAGGDHAVLALHGLYGNPLELRYIGRQLHHAGYTVVIPLIPGYGYARGSAGNIKTAKWQHWYQEVERQFDALKKRYKTVSVIGLCIGAVLALRLAEQHSSGIAALGLFAPTLAYDGWSIPRYRFLLPLVYYTPFRFTYSYQERFPDGLKNEVLRNRIAQEMRKSDASTAGASALPAEGIFQAHRLIREVRRHLGDVRTPTLIVHAAQDDVASRKSADLVEAKIGAQCRRKVILQNSYHMITLDNDKEIVAREIIDFLAVQRFKADARPSPVSTVQRLRFMAG
ncbi:alpha/beta hydrolase [Herbaspirillum seropedicae]|uniref:alpha/beta hydrolase n=1 Tax=Herbaspirillum seropedicae TaxID=964 RepID=UPI0028571725|nr:alpha/beta fold hydrolase [Herbaspirillum seropedicae]MDR6397506.1 carboxylesterase [Herbaspirillum seropedicae]